MSLLVQREQRDREKKTTVIHPIRPNKPAPRFVFSREEHKNNSADRQASILGRCRKNGRGQTGPPTNNMWAHSMLVQAPRIFFLAAEQNRGGAEEEHKASKEGCSAVFQGAAGSAVQHMWTNTDDPPPCVWSSAVLWRLFECNDTAAITSDPNHSHSGSCAALAIAYMHTCIHVRTCIHMYTCTHVYMYMCTRTRMCPPPSIEPKERRSCVEVNTLAPFALPMSAVCLSSTY